MLTLQLQRAEYWKLQLQRAEYWNTTLKSLGKRDGIILGRIPALGEDSNGGNPLPHSTSSELRVDSLLVSRSDSPKLAWPGLRRLANIVCQSQLIVRRYFLFPFSRCLT